MGLASPCHARGSSRATTWSGATVRAEIRTANWSGAGPKSACPWASVSHSRPAGA